MRILVITPCPLLKSRNTEKPAEYPYSGSRCFGNLFPKRTPSLRSIKGCASGPTLSPRSQKRRKRSGYAVVACPYIDVLPSYGVILAALAGCSYPAWHLFVSGTCSRNTEEANPRDSLDRRQEKRAGAAFEVAVTNYLAGGVDAACFAQDPARPGRNEAVQVDHFPILPKECVDLCCSRGRLQQGRTCRQPAP